MTVVVFAGPSIGRDAAPAGRDWDWRPPAAQGDVYRAALGRPRAIAFIDGFFHGVPAVWHKEILWALAQGIHVLGASSMGALRAAELADFGMRGVGRIFRDFRDGVLTDDDEVAVLHAPGELGWTPLSEAMVNIRATLARAVAEAVLPPASADAVVATAKRTFYQQRDWPAVIDAAPIHARERAALRDWLPAGRVDLKRADAAELLETVAAFIAGDPPPLRVDWRLERTDLWEAVIASAPVDEAGARVLDELRLDPDRFAAVRRRALARLVATRAAGDVAPADLRAAETAFRAARGLYDRGALDRWCAAAGLDPAGFRRLMAEEAALEAMLAEEGPALAAAMLSELRADGGWPALSARARDKQALAAPGGPAQQPLYPLAQWFFEERLGREVPEDLDLFARRLGLPGRDALARILARELSYYLSLPGGQDKPSREQPLGGKPAT